MRCTYVYYYSRRIWCNFLGIDVRANEMQPGTQTDANSRASLCGQQVSEMCCTINKRTDLQSSPPLRENISARCTGS